MEAPQGDGGLRTIVQRGGSRPSSAVWGDRTVVKALERLFPSSNTGDRLARYKEDRNGQVFELLHLLVVTAGLATMVQMSPAGAGTLGGDASRAAAAPWPSWPSF